MLSTIKSLLSSAKAREQVLRFGRLFTAAVVADPVASALVHGRALSWVAIEGVLVAAAEVAFRQAFPAESQIEAEFAKLVHRTPAK